MENLDDNIKTLGFFIDSTTSDPVEKHDIVYDTFKPAGKGNKTTKFQPNKGKSRKRQQEPEGTFENTVELDQVEANLGKPGRRHHKGKQRQQKPSKGGRKGPWIEPDIDEGDLEVIKEYYQTKFPNLHEPLALDEMIGDEEKLASIGLSRQDFESNSDDFPEVEHLGWEHAQSINRLAGKFEHLLGVGSGSENDSDNGLENDSEDDSEQGSGEEASASINPRQPSKRALKKERRRENQRGRQELDQEGAEIMSKLAKGGFSVNRILYQKQSMTSTLIEIFNPLHERIKAFASQVDCSRTMFPAMPSFCRKILKQLCAYYGLRYVVHGKGQKKTSQMFFSANTRVPDENLDNVVPYFVDLAMGGNPAQFQLNQRKPKSEMSNTTSKKQLKRQNKKQAAITEKRAERAERRDKRREAQESTAADHAIGSFVGGNAAPLGDENVGHQMMLKLGWKPGQTLGSSNDGLAEPIQVEVRARRRGLGN